MWCSDGVGFLLLVVLNILPILLINVVRARQHTSSHRGLCLPRGDLIDLIGLQKVVGNTVGFDAPLFFQLGRAPLLGGLQFRFCDQLRESLLFDPALLLEVCRDLGFYFKSAGCHNTVFLVR